MNNKKILEGYKAWKQRKRRIVASIIFLSFGAGAVGIGLGYAIWHNKSPKPPIHHHYTLHISHRVMIGSIDNAAVLEFREDGVLISSGVTYKVIESCSDVIIENNLLKYNTPVSVKTTITIKGTYNNYTAESSVDLLPADTSHILDPTKADWLDYFKAKPGEVIESDSRTDDFDKNFENSNYTMIDFSDFSSIGDDAFWNCESLTNGSKDITITFENFKSQNDTTSVQDGAFIDCARIKNLILPKATTESNIFTIGQSFGGCSGLENVSLPTGGSTASISIGRNAFTECTQLKNFNTSNITIASIGDHAFDGCTGLININLSGNDTNSSFSIGGGAFNRCTNLKEIHLPKGATSIGPSAFRDCAKLNKLYWYNENNPTEIGSLAFFDCPISSTNIIYFNNKNPITAWAWNDNSSGHIPIDNRPTDWTYTGFTPS